MYLDLEVYSDNNSCLLWFASLECPCISKLGVVHVCVSGTFNDFWFCLVKLYNDSSRNGKRLTHDIWNIIIFCEWFVYVGFDRGVLLRTIVSSHYSFTAKRLRTVSRANQFFPFVGLHFRFHAKYLRTGTNNLPSKTSIFLHVHMLLNAHVLCLHTNTQMILFALWF